MVLGTWKVLLVSITATRLVTGLPERFWIKHAERRPAWTRTRVEVETIMHTEYVGAPPTSSAISTPNIPTTMETVYVTVTVPASTAAPESTSESSEPSSFSSTAFSRSSSFSTTSNVASSTSASIDSSETFIANINVGDDNAGSSTNYRESARFRVYDAQNATAADAALQALEAARSCFVDTLGLRDAALTMNTNKDNTTHYKINVYAVSDLNGAAGVQGSNMEEGLAFLKILQEYIDVDGVTVHEYGHALTFSAEKWIIQENTGAWWEGVAQVIADVYMTHDVCQTGRSKFDQPTGTTIMDVKKVVQDSFQVIVDGTSDPASGEPEANHYSMWPFWTYLFNNPDNIAAFGDHKVFPRVFDDYEDDSNETPLHTIERMLKSYDSNSNFTVQSLVGRYWARMAFVDIGHPQGQKIYLDKRSEFQYDAVDNSTSGSSGTISIQSSKRPRYMGANIIPLSVSGDGKVSAKVSVTNSGSFTGTLVVRSPGDGSVRYVDMVDGSAETTVSSSDEVCVVVANTPDLVMYNASELTDEVNKGLEYTLSLEGASVKSGY